MEEAGCHSSDAVRDALARILESPDFDATDRIRRFLSYVVDETLKGRPDRIKAYSIATSVFGRDETFDPQVDSIVRIVAGRMRRSLERYYLTGGKDDPLRIRIPKGSYVPVFEDAAMALEDPLHSHGGELQKPGKIGPSILVGPFIEEGDLASYPNLGRGLARSLVVGLARFTNLRVFGTEPLIERVPGPASGGADEVAVDYILSGGTTVGSDRFWADMLLVDARSGRTVWADSFERGLVPSEIFALRSEVANRVARTLAQPYGVIYSDRAQETEGSPPERLSSYDCVLYFYQYWRTFDQDIVDRVRDCLERTIRSEPHYSEAFACLSLVYSNIHRFGNGNRFADTDFRERAQALADRAVELAPSSSWGHYARSLAYWSSRDIRASLAAFETARALNPNDTAIAADLGQRYAMLAEWEKAVPLLEESFSRNPVQPGSYRLGLFFYHCAHGRFEEALREARKIGTPHMILGPMAIAVAAAHLGDHEEAVKAVGQMIALDASYGDHVVADLESRNLHPDLIRMAVDGLRKAGLQGRDTGFLAAESA
ncbi:adenylate cyclase [Mesorhizobium sp. L-8-3]|nr:adenylate cyclase [Mesorhizobium sp. L-8-3]